MIAWKSIVVFHHYSMLHTHTASLGVYNNLVHKE